MPEEQNGTAAETVQPIAGAAQQQPVSAILPGTTSNDGVDRPQMQPDFFLGFPITDVLPTYDDIEGKVILFDDGTARAIAVFLSGAWRFAPLDQGMGFAEIYGSSDITVTFPNTTDYRTIAGGSNGAERVIDADAGNFRILVPASAYDFTAGKGVYHAIFTATFQADAAADFQFGILVNTVEQANLVHIVQVSTTGEEHVVTVAGLLDFSAITAQRTVTARVKSSSTTPNLTIKKYNLTLHRVG